MQKLQNNIAILSAMGYTNLLHALVYRTAKESIITTYVPDKKLYTVTRKIAEKWASNLNIPELPQEIMDELHIAIAEIEE